MESTITSLGRYELERPLGRGGYATVYRARDPVLRRHVAVKALLPHLADDPAVRGRFLAEARAIARLRHPNIVTVYDVGEADGRPFFAMELVDGPTLAAVIASGDGLDPAWVIGTLRSLGAAVDCLHENGLLHRDIKAANVMLDRSGRVVLMDFGIARALDEPGTTGADVLLGTPVSMAPEQVRGEHIGPAADVYALGVLAYQMLAGRPPFVGDTAHVLHAHAFEPPPPLCALRPGLPDPVYAAIDAALAKDPAQRPAGAGQLAAALTDAAPPPVRRRPPRGYAVSTPTLDATRPVRHGRHSFRYPRVPPALLRQLRRRLAIALRTRRRPVAAAGTGTIIVALVLATVLVGLVGRSDGGGAGAFDGVGVLSTGPWQPPVVTGLRVYDNVFAMHEGQFEVGDSVAACFTLRPGTDKTPLYAVVVPADAGPLRDANDPAVVARSDAVAQRAEGTCYPVRVLAPPLAAGVYRLAVMHGSEQLDGRRFIARARPGDTLLSETFDSAAGALPAASPDPSRYQLGSDGGEYVIRKVDAGWGYVLLAPLAGTFENATITVDARVVGDAAGRLLYVACRAGAGGHYRLTVDPAQGRLSLSRFDGDTQVNLVERQSTAIRRGGAANRLALTCAGETIAAAVNGTPVASVQDTTHRGGQLWIGVSSAPATPAEARFDNLTVVQR